MQFVGIRHLLMIGLGILTLLLATVSAGSLLAAAQQPYGWSPDERVEDYLDDTFPPYLLADQNRTVHALASQWVGDQDKQLAIVYRQWSLDGGWTTPVDILLSPDGAAQIVGAFLDQTGTMHVAFAGGSDPATTLYYSRAPVISAGHAPAWSKPQVVAEDLIAPLSGALTGDDKGNLVIVYSGNLQGNGVYGLRSSDAGDKWSQPEPIFLTYDRVRVPFSLRLTMGQSGQVHAVWGVVGSEGEGISVHYTRLDVAHQQWSEPFLLEERIEENGGAWGPLYPSVAVDGNNIVVMYISGNPSTGDPVPYGRPVERVRLSGDGGRTWERPTTPFPRHTGVSGQHSLVVDGDHVVHALFIQRIDQTVDGKYVSLGGIWHSELRGDRWSEPDRFSPQVPPHDVRAVVSQGNLLLAAWHEDPGAGENGVWYSYTALDAPELPVVPLPSPTAAPSATPTPTATPPGPTPTPRLWSASIGQEAMPSGVSAGPAIPLVLGLVPVVLLVVAIILVRRMHYRGRP